MILAIVLSSCIKQGQEEVKAEFTKLTIFLDVQPTLRRGHCYGKIAFATPRNETICLSDAAGNKLVFAGKYVALRCLLGHELGHIYGDQSLPPDKVLPNVSLSKQVRWYREFAADKFGLQLAWAMGDNPLECIAEAQRWDKYHGNTSDTPTHPSMPKRINEALGFVNTLRDREERLPPQLR